MKSREIIPEASPLTLEGSFTRDLVVSKLWLLDTLQALDAPRFHTAYILGSWYGNLSLFMIARRMPVDHIVNVDRGRWLGASETLAQRLGMADDIEYMQADANDLDYRQATPPSIVINTSVNDMPNTGWFDSIPDETWVAVQGRNHVSPGAANDYTSLEAFDQAYPLGQTLTLDSIELQDPEVKYSRWMKIGIK